MIPRSTRIAAFSSALALTALSLVVLPSVSLTPATPVLADSPSCIEGFADYPNLKGLPHHSNTDTEVNGYFAGNFTTASGASEMEGTFVIGGAANFNSGAYFNIGSVGAGSQVTPVPMSDMLITGGNVVVGASPNHIEVGNLIGGNIVSGGTVTGGTTVPNASVTTNGGTVTQNAASPLAPYAAIPTGYQALSTTLDALADTGTVTNDAGNVYFDGNGTDTRQVFTVAGTVLGAIGTTKSMVFTNIPTDAVVIVNVTGTTAVVSANVFSFSTNGTPGATINPMAAEPDRVFSHFTQSLMWNFTSATTVTLGDQDQLLGSILVPTVGSSLQLYTSTNGRIYVNGDVRLGGSTQTGLEIHNYPFRDTCALSTGSLSITKALSDPADIVSDTRAFTGTYSCVDSAPTVVASGTWSVTSGATQTVSGIPTGASCTITEDTLSTPPHATDTSYVWGTPTYSPTSQTIGAGTTVNITATNSFTRSTGSFAITKSLTDPDSVVASGRTFTGSYTCTPLSGSAITGSWSVTVGATQTVTNVPVGSTCSITEDALTVAPSSTDPSYIWGAPTFSPATVTTTSGTVTITATNTVTQGTGSFTIDKSLTDPDSVVASGRTFTGTYSCTTGGAPVTGSWSVTAATTQTIAGIPAGAVCSITEDALTVAPSATDSSYAWGAPTYSPSTVGITAGGNVTITATNTVSRGLGHVDLVKVLDDPFNVVSPTRVYTGTYDCAHLSTTVSSGTWSTTVGAAAITLATNLPAGTVCTVAEDASTLAAPPLAGYPQYIWRSPTYAPTTITIVDGVTGRFTVTNTVYDPFALLAATGTDAALPLSIGGGLLGAGVVIAILGYRRRRSA